MRKNVPTDVSVSKDVPRMISPLLGGGELLPNPLPTRIADVETSVY